MIGEFMYPHMNMEKRPWCSDLGFAPHIIKS